MIARLTRTAASFLVVLFAFWAYELLAVPRIEPEAKGRSQRASTANKHLNPRAASQRYTDRLAKYFPPGHWTLQNPKVLENDQAMVLIKDYRPIGDDQIELVPCVLIFFPQAASPSAEQGSPVILEAPEGAVLRFSEGFDLAQAKVGRLVYGKLQGTVSIRSDMKQSGTEDDLRITTRDVQMTESRVWTDHPVKFRLGKNSGQGRRMEIRLLEASGKTGKSGLGMNVAGLQSFELSEDVKLLLALEDAAKLTGQSKSTTPASASPAPMLFTRAGAAQPPLEITCQGPFHFDLLQYVATFEDEVDVVRANPSGLGDQLSCQMLSIFFARQEDATESHRPLREKASLRGEKGAYEALTPVRVEALGNPVTVRVPSSAAHVRCQKLAYDLLERKITLSDEREVALFHAKTEVHAPNLQYTLGDQPGDLGTLRAAGPGFLSSVIEGDPPQTFFTRWQEELHLRPHENAHVLSVLGRPRLQLAGSGELMCNELHLWLRSLPLAPKEGDASSKPAVAPDRLMAEGDVQIRSQPLTGAAERLEVWFAQAEETVTGSSEDPPRRPSFAIGRQGSPAVSSFDVRGGLIRLRLTMRGGKADVSDISVEQRVRLRETKTGQPEDKPLAIDGDRLQLTGADTPAAQIAVVGGPAHVEARGMSLEGAAIELDRGTNRLWINGRGSLSLPVRQAASPGPSSDVTRLTVDWLGKMDFDGRTARFERSVFAQTTQQQLRTEALEVALKQKILFAQSTPKERPELHRIACDGGVFLENHELDDQGRRQAIDRIESRDLSIDQTTGRIAAQGPGWITTVRLKTSDPLAHPEAAVPRPDPMKADPLEYLRVNFTGHIEGNTAERRVGFVNDVRAVYGPVADWDDAIDLDELDVLGESGVMLRCDRLNVTEMRIQPKQRGTIELEALGNALVEGRTFTARAARMAYAQAKELIVLEGRGGDAQLWRQMVVGGPTQYAAAGKILYWRLTNRVEVNDWRFLDLSQIGTDSQQQRRP